MKIVADTNTIVFKKTPKSPFDIKGLKTKATTKDILTAIKDSRKSRVYRMFHWAVKSFNR